MAVIDKLLQVVERMGNGSALLLEPGREARLAGADGERALTRAPVDHRTILRLLHEVAPSPPSLQPEAGEELEFHYSLGDTAFLIRATVGAEGWCVAAHRANGAYSIYDFDGAKSVNGAASPNGAEPGPASNGSHPPSVDTPPEGTSVGESGRPLPAVPDLLRQLVAAGGSDLHLTSQEAPRWRIDGDLLIMPDHQAAAPERLRALLYEITPPRNREEIETRNDTDFAYEIPGTGRFRVNLFRDRLGIGAVMRQIPEKIPSADDLGLPESIRRLAHLAKGLVLVTGPTGSGKSTTLAALIDLINRTRNDHIITIEDPVEFVHPSRSCLVNQREVHVHTASFKQALRAALREDPDIILVGEMRDLETIAMAIETAETGHLVFGTLHTTTAISTVERLVDQFPGDRQDQVRMMLAESLKAVIAQALLKRVGGGRVAAQEILLANPAVSNLIREGKTFQLASAMQTGRAKGMVLMNDAFLDLVKRGVVAPREAYLKAVDKEGLLKAYKNHEIELELETE